MNNKDKRDKLVARYGYMCWLHDNVNRKNKLTYHHVVPVRYGGEGLDPIKNGALLSENMHRKFNILERMYPELAAEINKFLIIYKGHYPTEVWDKIVRLLDLVEMKENRNDGRNRCNTKRRKRK